MYLIWTLLIIIFIDGLKMVFESIKRSYYPVLKNSYDEVTVMMSAYNEEALIVETIRSFVDSGFKPSQIFIVDDGSTDNTSRVILESGYDVTLYSISNHGKANALKWLLSKVKTRFVMIVDADVVLQDNFHIPLDRFDSHAVTGIAFNIVPINQPESFFNQLAVNFQRHEYNKSMMIGRMSKNKTQSVSCISGAAGVFETERLRLLSSLHSGVFSGEDLQRTLIDLLNGGSVIFSESIVYTDVPETFELLTKQRVKGWWGGLYHCFPLFLKILIYRRSSAMLRYEMLYDILSIISDPLKLICFIGLLYHQDWISLAFIYSLYTLLEITIFSTIKTKSTLTLSPLVIVPLYAFYTFYQMLMRMTAFTFYIYKRFILREWGSLQPILRILTISGLTFFANTAKAQSKKDWVASVETNHLNHNYNNSDYSQNLSNITTYIGYKSFWAEGSFLADQRYTAGAYFKNGNTWLRFRDQDVSAFGAYQFHNSKKFPHSISATYQHIYQYADHKNIMIPGVQFEQYVGDYSRFTLDFRQEFGRLGDFNGLVRYYYKNKDWNVTAGAGLNSYLYKTGFAVVGYKMVYMVASYTEKYDYSNYDRISLGIGIKARF